MKKTVMLSIVLVLCVPVIAFSQAGKPFEALQHQIDALQSQITSLQQQINNIQLIPGPAGPPGVANGIKTAVYGYFDWQGIPGIPEPDGTIVKSDNLNVHFCGCNDTYPSSYGYTTCTYLVGFNEEPFLATPPLPLCLAQVQSHPANGQRFYDVVNQAIGNECPSAWELWGIDSQNAVSFTFKAKSPNGLNDVGAEALNNANVYIICVQ